MDFRLKDFKYPFAIFKLRRQLEKSQWASLDELNDIQERLLGKLVRHCYENVPYYTQLFTRLGLDPEDIKAKDDLKHIPVLTKQIIRDNFQALQAKDSHRYSPLKYRTGGTTGTPLEFFVDKNANIMEFAAVWRHWNWAGYRFGNKFCDLRGKIIKGHKPYVYDWRLNAMFLSSYRMTKDLVDVYADQLRRFKPAIIRGYPSAIDMFATFLKEKGITDIRPRSVVTSSETLLSHQRQNLEAAFGCAVFDTYGLEERAAAAGQCPHGKMHQDVEYGIIRVLDEDGNDLPKGHEGEMVCTGLHNYVMPLINLRTNDIGSYSVETCSCGRNLPVLNPITGRVEDMIRTPDGRHVAGSGLSVAIKHSLGIKVSQIVQEELGEMRVKIVRNEFFGEEDEVSLLRNLRDRVGDVIRIRLDYVPDIPLTKAGKLKFVISNVQAE